jgi:predicted alpha/beta hydrolase family esterase
MTLLTNNSKCPVIAQFHSTLNGVMNRGQAMSLVSHSAECSICVPVLRTVDKQIVAQYIAAPRVQAPASMTNLLSRDVAPLVERAKLNQGWAPRENDRHARFHIKRAVVYGFISTLLIAVAIFVALQN